MLESVVPQNLFSLRPPKKRDLMSSSDLQALVIISNASMLFFPIIYEISGIFIKELFEVVLIHSESLSISLSLDVMDLTGVYI